MNAVDELFLSHYSYRMRESACIQYRGEVKHKKLQVLSLDEWKSLSSEKSSD